MCACMCCRVWLFVTPWTVASQAPLSMECFNARITGVDCYFLLQGIFPTKGSNQCLGTPALAGGFFTAWATWEAQTKRSENIKCWEVTIDKCNFYASMHPLGTTDVVNSIFFFSHLIVWQYWLFNSFNISENLKHCQGWFNCVWKQSCHFGVIS